VPHLWNFLLEPVFKSLFNSFARIMSQKGLKPETPFVYNRWDESEAITKQFADAVQAAVKQMAETTRACIVEKLENKDRFWDEQMDNILREHDDELHFKDAELDQKDKLIADLLKKNKELKRQNNVFQDKLKLLMDINNNLTTGLYDLGNRKRPREEVVDAADAADAVAADAAVAAVVKA